MVGPGTDAPTQRATGRPSETRERGKTDSGAPGGRDRDRTAQRRVRSSALTSTAALFRI